MATKYASSVDSGDVFEDPDSDSVSVPLIIEGLKHVGGQRFTLTGLRVREVDWESVARAMGFGEMLPMDLHDDLAHVLWQHDITQALRNRVRRA